MELLECPFCGGKPTIRKGVSVYEKHRIWVGWSVACLNCGKAKTEQYPTVYEIGDEDEMLERVAYGKPLKVRDGHTSAISEWNYRATKAEQEAKSEEAEPQGEGGEQPISNG